MEDPTVGGSGSQLLPSSIGEDRGERVRAVTGRSSGTSEAGPIITALVVLITRYRGIPTGGIVELVTDRQPLSLGSLISPRTVNVSRGDLSVIAVN